MSEMASSTNNPESENIMMQWKYDYVSDIVEAVKVEVA